jgi:hypothetical protein
MKYGRPQQTISRFDLRLFHVKNFLPRYHNVFIPHHVRLFTIVLNRVPIFFVESLELKWAELVKPMKTNG